MQTNGTNDKEEYIKVWAERMIVIWQEKLLAYKILDSHSLYNSLQQHIIHNSGGNIDVIEHFFNFYGIYVDKGTGKEVSKGNKGDLGFTPNRKPKPWFDAKFYYYTRVLAERMADITGKKVVYVIKNIIEGS
jgi:hypothetical protein